MIILGSGLSYGSVLRQHNDAVVALSHSNLVLGTNHAVRLDTAQLRFFDNKLLVAVIKHAAQIGYDNLLASSHVRSATDNLLRFALTKVDGGYMQVVRIGVHLASQHLAYEQSLKTTFYCLYFLKSIYFKSA